MPFDPSQPFEKLDSGKASASGFDPSQPFESLDDEEASSMPSSNSPLLNAVLHPLDAARSVGAYASQIGSNIPVLGPLAVKAGQMGAASLLSATKGEGFSDALAEIKAQEQAEEEAKQREHPLASTLAGLSGAAMVPLPGAGIAGLPGAAARIVGTAAMAATDEAARSSSIPEALSRAEKAGGVGGAISAGLEAVPLIGSVAGKLVDPLAAFAEKKAFKASVGNQAAAYDAAVRQNQVNKIGRDLLEDNIVGFGSNARSIAEGAEAARKDYGSQIGDLLQKIDEKAPNLVDATSIASSIRDYTNKIKSPGNVGIVSNLEEQANKFEALGKLPLSEAQRLKNTYKWDPRDPAAMPIGKDAANQIKSIIGDEMDSAVAKYNKIPSVGSEFGATEGLENKEPSGAADLYGYLKGKYGSMASSSKNAEKLANRLDKNRMPSLTDYIAGGIGSVLGAATGLGHGAILGLGGAVVNKIGRERGPASIASVFDKLSQSAGAVEKYGPVLKQAADRGSTSFAITHYLLGQRDPDYQAITSGGGQ